MASVEENGLRIRWIGCRAVVETVEVERRMEVGYERSYVAPAGKNGELRYTSDTPLGYLVGGGSRAKNESTKNLRSSHHDRERETGTMRPIVSWKLI
ncbi:hypothetical protein ALC62_10070 [Cyphomyrmex costatus]|uniref:Uncharacterized protein n=1 Tax=Cyphomyrmex costatus TaxID=456900 RepID=A0A151IEE8_9HYME|nr:hypothetical protein ALC62_10070 [Cyphomyrmex costatus]